MKINVLMNSISDPHLISASPVLRRMDRRFVFMDLIDVLIPKAEEMSRLLVHSQIP